MKIKKSTIKVIVSLIVVVAVVVLGYFSLPLVFELIKYLIKLFLPFLLGYLFALVAKPLVSFIQKWIKVPRGVASIIVMVLILGILGSIIGTVIYKIVDEIKNLYEYIQGNYASIEKSIMGMVAETKDFFSNLHPSIQEAINTTTNNMLERFGNFINNNSEPMMNQAGNIAKALPGIFIGVIVFLLSSFFMLVDYELISTVIHKVFKGNSLEKFERVKLEIRNYLGGYVKAQLLIMSIAFCIMLISFSILKVEFGFVIALGIAVLDALPFFGSGAALWPWSIVSFVNGDLKRGFGIIIVYVIIFMTRQLIEPKIVSSKIGLHPILTLLSMYVGYRVLSVGGMILGPLILMLIISFYKAGVFDGLIRFMRGMWNFFKAEFNIIKNYIKELGE